MNTEEAKTELENQLATFNLNDAHVRALCAKYEHLALTSWEDEAGYKEIKSARFEVRKTKDVIETKKKELKSAIEKRAKELGAPLDKSDQYLTSQLRIREDELSRIKDEEANREKRETERRVNLAMAINWQKPMYLLQAMTLEDFERDYLAAKEIHESNLKIDAENAIILKKYEEAQKKELENLRRENEELKKKQASEEKHVDDMIEFVETEKAKGISNEDAMVHAEFPTLPLAWAEIIRLRKEMEVF